MLFTFSNRNNNRYHALTANKPVPENYIMTTLISDIGNNVHIQKVYDSIFKKKSGNHVYNNNIQVTTPYNTIINVYKEKYKNANCHGIGDFIRGSYFILEYCSENNLNCDITFVNHPVSSFLKNNNDLNINSNDICLFMNQNFIDEKVIEPIQDTNILHDLNNYLKTQPVINSQKLIATTAFPIKDIPDTFRTRMQNILEPNDSMKLLIEETLCKLQLTNISYLIFHIRLGDKYLIKNSTTFNINMLGQITKHINNILRFHPNQKILLMADNNLIKKILASRYKNIVFINNDITHTGEGVKINIDKLQNTMLDFYLISRSSKIYSLSVYRHGSGFSRWCAETYNIPYKWWHITD